MSARRLRLLDGTLAALAMLLAGAVWVRRPTTNALPPSSRLIVRDAEQPFRRELTGRQEEFHWLWGTPHARRAGVAIDTTERCEPVGSEIEQTFTFSTHPSGSGPLEISFEVSGLGFEGADARGLVFGAGQGRKVRYSHGVWIDARGHRTPVLSQYSGGRIVLSLSAQTVDTSQYPAVLDPIVSTELAVDAVFPAPSAAAQQIPRVAFSGGTTLAVWQDWRVPTSGRTQQAVIMGTRISAAGLPLDPTGIVISAPGTDGKNLVVGNLGNNFLVAWHAGSQVWATRVTPGGVVLDGSPIQVSRTPDVPGDMALAASAGHALVVWRSVNVAHGYVYGVRVAVDGSVLDTTPLTLADQPDWTRQPALAAAASEYLLAYVTDRFDGGGSDLITTRVAFDGGTLGSNVVLQGVPQLRDPALVHTGSGYVMTWTEERAIDQDLFAGSLDSLGRLTSSMAVCQEANAQFGSSLVFDGTNVIAVWNDERVLNFPDVYGARITPAGAVMDVGGVRIGSAGTGTAWPASTIGSAGVMIAWADYRSLTDWEVYGSAVSATLTPATLSGTRLSGGGNDQTDVAVAYGAGLFLAVWADYRNANFDIYGARIDPAGTVLDSNAIAICTAPEWQRSPAVAFNGTDFVVTWSDGRLGRFSPDIFAARVSPSGVVKDPSGTAVSQSAGDQNWPSITSDGERSLIAWFDTRTFGDADIYLATLDRQGQLVGAERRLGTLAGRQEGRPRTATVNGTSLLVWSDSAGAVRSARQLSDGGLLDEPGTMLFPFSTDDFAVAATRTEFVAAAADRGTVHLTRVSAATGLAGGSAQMPGDFDSVTVLPEGDQAWIVYRDRGADVYEARAFANGVLGASAVPLSGTRLVNAAAAAQGPLGGLFAYSRYDGDRLIQASKVRACFVDGTAPAAPTIDNPPHGGTTASMPTVTGLAEAYTVVNAYIDDAGAGSVRASADGQFSLVVAPPLSNGLHDVFVTATDNASNVSPPSERHVFLVAGGSSGGAGGGAAGGTSGTGGQGGQGGASGGQGGASGGAVSLAVGCGCASTRSWPGLLWWAGGLWWRRKRAASHG